MKYFKKIGLSDRTTFSQQFCCYPSNQLHLGINKGDSHLITLNF